jgi:hypothetical protein
MYTAENIIFDNDLKQNIDKLHTTKLGIDRIKQNLDLKTDDVVDWCRQKIALADEITRKGKNWYIFADNSVIITVNAYSYTIITAHDKNKKVKRREVSEYEKARQLGIPRDWYSIFIPRINTIVRYIAVELLLKGMSIETVYKVAGLSKKERMIKNDYYWDCIIAELKSKKFDMLGRFRTMINERLSEIAINLLKRNDRVSGTLSIGTISDITGLTKEQIKQLKSDLR